MAIKLVRAATIVLFIGGSLMALAGDWRSPWLWSLTGTIAVLVLWVMFKVLDPDLARERFRPPTRGADSTALAWIRASALALWVFAPLDAGRLHWSAAVPPALRLIGICGFAVGAWFTFRAMAANRFFSPVVRVQSERGHHVIDTGPYRSLRHPGYLGMAVFAPMAALALGSWWALIPAGLYAMLILRRAAVEDRFLHGHLPGYAEYATRVRFRVLPGIW
ncbi:MAG: isoprenylcysteine carboxylmethyltransferase family protein [Acidobacteria bacterium]|nr:MAG: isoprenylcysteine carboxylmethyltransferase family protein [Acidobacteriota bacterium]